VSRPASVVRVDGDRSTNPGRIRPPGDCWVQVLRGPASGAGMCAVWTGVLNGHYSPLCAVGIPALLMLRLLNHSR